MLAKQREFWKAKSCNVVAWAFFTSSSSSSSKVHSSTPQSKQLKCVICAPIVRLEKGIITYKTMNGISSLSKHLESIHRKLWGEWIVWEKEGLECEQ